MDIERHIALTRISRNLKVNWERDIVEFHEVRGGTFSVSDEERKDIEQRIENGLEFAREILNDPPILEHIPSGSKVDAVFKDQRDAAEH
jgi:hypothetical protein